MVLNRARLLVEVRVRHRRLRSSDSGRLDLPGPRDRRSPQPGMSRPWHPKIVLHEEKHVAQGTVKWFNAPDDGGADVFVRHSAIEMDGYRTLQDNQRVEYTAGQGTKGPQAEQVRPIRS